MQSSLILLLSVLGLSCSASAKIEVLPPIKAASEIQTWLQDYSAQTNKMLETDSYPAEGYTQCRETVEIPDAFLCQSSTREEMNSALLRASFFIEGLSDPSNKGPIKRQDDSDYGYYKDIIGGHDLRGEDLLRFHKKSQEECAAGKNDAKVCADAFEKDMFETFIVPEATKRKNFVVITFASRDGSGWRDVVTHEIMHAQYFTQPLYKEAVDAFWETDVSPQDKASVIASLSQYYDGSDELLMKNEFQAYMLMSGAESSLLGNLVMKYRPALMKKLEAKGVKPIQVQ